MIACSVIAVLLFAGVHGASSRTEHMTVSKMRIADLETSASGYAYNQHGALPVSYTLYTNHGSGRYHAPAPVHYIVGSPAPVAPAVSETASSHDPVLLAYATARHEIAPYVARQPYPRDGFINYGVGQLAKYAQPLEPPKLTARAPYYAPNGFKPRGTYKNADKRGDDGENENDYDGVVDDVGDKKVEKSHVPENRERAVDFIATRPIHGLDNSRSDIDVSFERGEKYSAAQNSAHGEKGDKGYNKRVEFDVGERELHDKSRQQEHYDTETGHKNGHSDVAGNYGSYYETESGEKGSSYGQTSYHKKGQKTSGFHKVYHKDEYKKNTDFYDESHKKGYFDKYSVADKHHNAAEGDFKKGGHHESGFDNKNNGKKGYYDKGHVQNRDQGYNKEKGDNSFHNNYENYGSSDSERLTKKHGHDEVD